MNDNNDVVLEVRNLEVEYHTDDAVIHAVNGINLKVRRGETIGLVGETGAGKTTIARSILRILPTPPAKVVGGEILFEGEDIMKKSESAMRKIRGNKISMIFQDPMTALNPIETVGFQITEAVSLHNKLKKAEAEKRACDMLEMVGIPMERFNEYDYYPELDNQHDVYATGFNVEKAKELAEKSGLVGKTLHAITNGTSTYVTIAEILQTNLRDIGVTLEIENYDNATYMANSYDPTKFDIAIYGIASPQGFAAAMLYEYVLWGEPIYKDWEGYSKLVELGAEAVGNSDEASRKDQLLEMVKLFEEGCPWYAICDQKNSLAINKDIAGISLSIVGGGTLSYYKCYWVK